MRYLSGSLDLNTLQFDVSGMYTPRLVFDYAYATYTNEVDQLQIYCAADTGVSYTLLEVMPGGLTGILNTGGAYNGYFVPNASQWATHSVALPAGTKRIRFTAVGAYGNNLYLDNVRVEETPVPELLTVQGTLLNTQCYNATNTITVGGTAPFVMESGAIATFIAGQKIRYLAGSLVKSGSYMHGYISPTGNYCGTPPPVPFAASTGTDENSFSPTSGNKFLVFPNPADHRITIRSLQQIDYRQITVKVYGLPGTLVLQQEFMNTQRMELSLEDIPAGIYLITIQTGKEVETVKLIRR
jgi:hypothetical protein